ncbi:MAG: S8 family serine peptidase [Pseudomonadota bacterium]
MKTSPAGISTSLVFAAQGAASEGVGTSEFETDHGSADISKIRSLTMVDGKVLMEAVFADISAEDLENMLDAAGIDWRDDKGDPSLTITSFVTAAGTVRTFLSGFIDPAEVLNLPSIVSGDGYFISANPIGYQTSVGDTTSQGDAAQRSDDARTQFGVDGSGITIGVLSDSYGAEANASGTPTDTTVAQDIASGDLPAEGVLVLRDGAPFSTDGDEGRGMLQIIHDVAPGAALAFHTAGGGQAVFAQGILALRNTANADVIVDDIIYFAEPIFQDGIIAQAVDQVVADGAVYLSSAGNNGDDGFLDVYRDSGVDGGTIAALATGTGVSNLGNLHDWNSDPTVFSPYVELTLADGEDFSLSFQFDEAYASAGGAGSTADYDIFVTTVDAMGNETLEAAGIGFANNIGSDPIEIVDATNDSGGTLTYRIYITQFDAPDNVDTNLLAGIFFSSAGGFLEEDFNPEIISTLGGGMSAAPQFGAPTVFGHSNAEGALAVGASAFFNTPEFGLDPARLNSFSSLSGYDILFDALGNRLSSPDERDGVDFTAPDGGNTTFFGSDSGADADTFPNFFGTSAAAPHAAAVVALMLELNPNLTPTEVETILEGTGQTITLDSSGRSVGTDFTGTGLIDAVAALAAVPANSFDGDEGDNTITGNNNDNTIRGFAGNDTLDGAGGNDTVLGGLGDDVLFGSSGDNLLVGDEDTGGAAAAGIDPLAPVEGGGATSGTDPLPEDRFITQLINREEEYSRAEEDAPPVYDPLASIFGDIFSNMMIEDEPFF